jgi:multidrug efflux system membrane fusion protein
VALRPSLRLALLALLIAALGACSRSQEPAAGQGQTIPVTVATAVQKSVPIQVRAIGNVQPSETVTVRSRVGGVLAGVKFKEGQDVRENDPLFILESRPLQADLMQAQANLAKSQAQLDTARKDAARYAELYKRGLVAQAQYEQMDTQAKALEATVRADRAVVDNARSQVGYASIRAPIAGRTGALQVHEGDLVKANDTALVVINQLHPISVNFALPEQQLPDVQRYRAQGSLQVQAVHPTSGQPLASGALSFVDNRVDPATGTIQMKASFTNQDSSLWPGQFVNVVLTLATEANALVVPTPAVQTGQAGRYVFVVKPDQTVESRPVTVGRESGAETVIAQGLASGDTVVIDGQLRLFPGARVEARAAPAAPPAPGAPAAAPAPATATPGPAPAPAPVPSASPPMR